MPPYFSLFSEEFLHKERWESQYFVDFGKFQQISRSEIWWREDTKVNKAQAIWWLGDRQNSITEFCAKRIRTELEMNSTCMFSNFYEW